MILMLHWKGKPPGSGSVSTRKIWSLSAGYYDATHGWLCTAEEIRDVDPDIPLFFLSAKPWRKISSRDINWSADDYITKPFDGEVLFAENKSYSEAQWRRVTDGKAGMTWANIAVKGTWDWNRMVKSDTFSPKGMSCWKCWANTWMICYQEQACEKYGATIRDSNAAI